MIRFGILRLILPLLFSLCSAQLASGEEEEGVVWKIEKAGLTLAIRESSFTPQWGEKPQGGGSEGNALYFKYSDARATSTLYPSCMGGIAGIIEEGLAVKAVHVVEPVPHVRISFLKSGDVELRFDAGSSGSDVIVLSRKEALDLVTAVQRYHQKLIKDQQAGQAGSSRADQPSN
ncbi:hypothetical protein [Luteolibacter soli]|uniref:Uncharacterized protein n=1 Tax=Luteolibacter soli TaxID=3135280 RepID=A0ABU9AVG4_9BACT